MRGDRPDPAVARALADAVPRPYWLDRPEAPSPTSALVGDVDADLVVIGGGYTGLWTALLAIEADPRRDVVLLEAQQCGWAASGRNGGFCSASLTHGLANWAARWPDELPTLERLGRANLDAIEASLATHRIDASFERTGELNVAVAEWQLDDLAGTARLASELGHDVTLLDRDGVRAEVDSPTYLGGLWLKDTVATLDPARLVWGLRRVLLERGVRIFEHTPAQRLETGSVALRVHTPYGAVRARKAMLASNAFPALLRRLRPLTVPVYDYVLMTEPLSGRARASLRWVNRQGMSDAGNQFHYYRLTDDDRVLWGGYDAIYPFARQVRQGFEQRQETFAMLAGHFFTTFPQLQGVRFSHAWAGVIDTCTRFAAFTGTAAGGRVGYAMGFTGLGVGASRFAAATVLDLLDGRDSEATRLRMVRTRPVPFPPEPLRWAGIELTRRSLAWADANGGRRNGWLRTLDRLGMGFDS